MKYFILLLLFPIFSFSQQKSDTTEEDKKNLPYYIETCTDKFTDKISVYGSKSLLCSEDGKIGFALLPSWSINKNGELTYQGIIVKSAGIGSCVEKSTLILLFEDDTKTQISAWNDFNCEGNSYMDWNGRSYDKLFGKKVKSIRFMNGRTYESYTYNLPEKDQTFFVEVGLAFSQRRVISTGTCD